MHRITVSMRRASGLASIALLALTVQAQTPASRIRVGDEVANLAGGAEVLAHRGLRTAITGVTAARISSQSFPLR